MKEQELEIYKGLVCFHKITNTFMVIKKADYYKEKLHLHCLVKVEEEKEIYFADACYSNVELIITDFYIQDIIEEIQLKKGIQMELF